MEKISRHGVMCYVVYTQRVHHAHRIQGIHRHSTYACHCAGSCARIRDCWLYTQGVHAGAMHAYIDMLGGRVAAPEARITNPKHIDHHIDVFVCNMVDIWDAHVIIQP